MTTVPIARARKASRLRQWLLQGHTRTKEGPHVTEQAHVTHSWWQVMCLTGVDYFSTLGYQPGIAALAAGVLAPIATIVLVMVTLFGALPMYKRVAGESPHGDGSISMLARLLPWWQGKLFVLCLIGFVVTGFIITITLSAADAAAHITENPLAHRMAGHEIAVTLVIIALLGAIFLRGFSEAISIAVVLVAAYLFLNIIVISAGFYELFQHPGDLSNWKANLLHAYSNPLVMIGAALIAFPKLALGLSGFETGVVVMPLIRGDAADAPEHPAGRIHNARRLLTTAATIMSVLLIASSIITITLIPPEAFAAASGGQPAGKANGRALAYLAHTHLGNLFGTVYDASTVLILWFAGASAMAGLLNIVPRYLPRYGMAPDWTRATRPLVLIFIGICFLVTIIFRADVNAQAGAYATGVLALMTSATIAVTLSAKGKGEKRATIGFGIVSLIFIYTTAITIIKRPEGLKIALIFIAAIIVTSLASRAARSTELRVTNVELDETAARFIDEARRSEIRLIANHPDERSSREYLLKEREQRTDNHIPPGDPVLFLEVIVKDASEFTHALYVRGEEIAGFRVLRAESASAVPNAIAAFLLDLRDRTGKIPHAYFGWSEGNPLRFLMRFLLFGEGDTAPVTHEILRQAEPDYTRRPAIHVG
jgi:hypothetical protein